MLKKPEEAATSSTPHLQQIGGGTNGAPLNSANNQGGFVAMPPVSNQQDPSRPPPASDGQALSRSRESLMYLRNRIYFFLFHFSSDL